MDIITKISEDQIQVAVTPDVVNKVFSFSDLEEEKKRIVYDIDRWEIEYSNVKNSLNLKLERINTLISEARKLGIKKVES